MIFQTLSLHHPHISITLNKITIASVLPPPNVAGFLVFLVGFRVLIYFLTTEKSNFQKFQRTPMGYDKYFLQKCLFASFITAVNVTVISLANTYSSQWYFVQIPLMLVLFFNVMAILLSVIGALIKRNKKLPYDCIHPTTVGYFIPCYNESSEEINNSLNSFYEQVCMDKHTQMYLTVCDGRKRAAENSMSTDKLLKEEVFPNSRVSYLKGAYDGADSTHIDVEILTGTAPSGYPYFTIIKDQNCGKRDSIALMRRLFYAFNTQKCPPGISQQLLLMFTSFLRSYGILNLEFVIGVDADTAFENNCSIELLSEISRKKNILASSGMVKVTFPDGSSFKDKLWEGYQHVEYLAGQGLLRNQQNLTQQKINCLPGCLNITRVCEQTCGERLISEYVLPPNQNCNIFQQIRATASQDRHSVMLLLKMYKHCHTTVNWNAQAKTAVPINFSVFLSQRRRWSLGSATHGGWMIWMPNIPLWERFSSMIFVLTYLLTPFLMYSAVIWISVMASGRGDDTFYILTGTVQIVTLYRLVIPMWCPLKCYERFIYYLFYPTYLIAGPFMGMAVLFYSIYNMDDFGWGKTRQVVQQKQHEPMMEMTPTSTINTSDNVRPFPQFQLHSPNVTLSALSERQNHSAKGLRFQKQPKLENGAQ